MVVRIRLQRFGRHDRPFYRIVAADSRSPRDGRFIELLGSYDPIASKDGIKEVRIKGDRVKYWLSVGAQPSDRVAWLMAKYNLLPPAPLPPSTVQHLPKKERKELAEAAAKAGGGAKGYHTSVRRAAEQVEAAAFLTGGAMMAAGCGAAAALTARGSLGVGMPWARR